MSMPTKALRRRCSEVCLYLSLPSLNSRYFAGFVKLFGSMPVPRTPVTAPSKETLPAPSSAMLSDPLYDIPSLAEMGYEGKATTSLVGGEQEALRRLAIVLASKPAATKPKPTAEMLDPSDHVLSPYLKFGCLSAARLFHDAARLYPPSSVRGNPPVALHRQLLWREFFYMAAFQTPNFDKMVGNAPCRQIPWDRDDETIAMWREGRTGYPFIDAAMTQLRLEGWIHNEARQRVACFLTRGDLWQHWEAGMRVFDHWLIDADWAINTGNWQWMSCSRYYYQYGRCFSPITFGKQADPDGKYAKKWLPALARMPGV
jgi:cryptochrome